MRRCPLLSVCPLVTVSLQDRFFCTNIKAFNNVLDILLVQESLLLVIHVPMPRRI